MKRLLSGGWDVDGGGGTCQVRFIMSDMDANRDGVIALGEFSAALRGRDPKLFRGVFSVLSSTHRPLGRSASWASGLQACVAPAAFNRQQLQRATNALSASGAGTCSLSPS